MELKTYERFELAVDAVVGGDLAGLKAMLREYPDLARMRSRRVTEFDAKPHRVTLLHYIAANGVEGYRQKTPPNAVALAQAGAEVDALADLYGGECTTMSLLVSSCHPAEAGLQVDLVDLSVDFGGSVERGNWTSPLATALGWAEHCGKPEIAAYLRERGGQ